MILRGLLVAAILMKCGAAMAQETIELPAKEAAELVTKADQWVTQREEIAVQKEQIRLLQEQVAARERLDGYRLEEIARLKRLIELSDMERDVYKAAVERVEKQAHRALCIERVKSGAAIGGGLGLATGIPPIVIGGIVVGGLIGLASCL